jgi:hypothetical protein
MSSLLRLMLLCLVMTIHAQSLKSQFPPPQPPPPKSGRQGVSVSTIKNDSSAPIKIEVRVNGQWEAVTIDPGKDTTIPGDHLRVATNRPDSAVVSIDLPLQAGRKYRVFWNAQADMWDLTVLQ